MLGQLFRSDALEYQKDRLHGQVLVIPSSSHAVITIFLLIWVSAVLFWLTNSRFAKKETVLGWLEPPSGVVRVFPDTSTGKIKKILVKDGDQVVKGQPLVIVNGDKVLTNGTHLEDTLLKEYALQQSILNQQLARTQSIFQLKTADATQQLTASKGDLVQLDAQISTLNKRYQLAKEKADNFNKMVSNGFVSAIDGQSVVEQQLALQSQMESLQREKVNQKNRIEQLQTQLALLPSEQQNQLDELHRNLSDIAQRIAQLHGQRAYIVKATVNGIVSNLQVREGQQPQANLPLLTLLPENNAMEVKLLVPVRAAGFLKSGQPLEIRYDAFPYQKFGLYSGEVTNVSSSVLLPNELDKALAPINEPVYLVRAKLNSTTIAAYGQTFPLKVGMTLSADIKLKDRTLLEWLLEPLYSLKGKL